jgi:hypothetical protein
VRRVLGGDGLGQWVRPALRRGADMTLVHSVARENDGCIWSHVSLSRAGRMPSWDETADVFRLVHPHDYGVIVVAPAAKHVNIAEVAHVWCNLDHPAVPDFTHGLGSI